MTSCTFCHIKEAGLGSCIMQLSSTSWTSPGWVLLTLQEDCIFTWHFNQKRLLCFATKTATGGIGQRGCFFTSNNISGAEGSPLLELVLFTAAAGAAFTTLAMGIAGVLSLRGFRRGFRRGSWRGRQLPCGWAEVKHPHYTWMVYHRGQAGHSLFHFIRVLHDMSWMGTHPFCHRSSKVVN